MTDTKATLTVGNRTTELDVLKGTLGPDVIDIGTLGPDLGMFTYDPDRKSVV